MNTQLQDEVIDALGADSLETVFNAFGGKELHEILDDLEMMFPSEDNLPLATKIQLVLLP